MTLTVLLQAVHENGHVFNMKKAFSEPKIYTGGVKLEDWDILPDEIREKALEKYWHVYFSFRHPETGKMVRQKNQKAHANTFKTKEERLAVLEPLGRNLLFLLKNGFDPYQDNTHLIRKILGEDYLPKSIVNRVPQPYFSGRYPEGSKAAKKVDKSSEPVILQTVPANSIWSSTSTTDSLREDTAGKNVHSETQNTDRKSSNGLSTVHQQAANDLSDPPTVSATVLKPANSFGNNLDEPPTVSPTVSKPANSFGNNLEEPPTVSPTVSTPANSFGNNLDEPPTVSPTVSKPANSFGNTLDEPPTVSPTVSTPANSFGNNLDEPPTVSSTVSKPANSFGNNFKTRQQFRQQFGRSGNSFTNSFKTRQQYRQQFGRAANNFANSFGNRPSTNRQQFGKQQVKPPGNYNTNL